MQVLSKTCGCNAHDDMMKCNNNKNKNKTHDGNEEHGRRLKRRSWGVTLRFGKKQKLSFLKVWGCDAYVKKLQPDKLEPKSEKCVFIGYPKETVGYTFYHRS